ncbi:MAG: hypothetical protein KGJ37_00250 [Verrucomicrobiota bacterium]|nr:hypothetical protein [Verrucomicrobiota bacterium]
MLSLLFSGCGGSRHRNNDMAPPLGPKGKPIPVMTARDSFFEGRLVVEVILSRGYGRSGYTAAPVPGMPSEDDYDYEKKITPELIEEIYARRGESPLPPAELRLKLTNTTKEVVQAEVVDFDSELGNFVVQPERLTIGPEQSAEPDPMFSRLGVDSTTIPVTVALRSNGKIEKRILNLHSITAKKPATQS